MWFFLTCALPNSDATRVIILVTIAANGTIQLANPGAEALQGLQAVTMANSGGAQQGTTILQYAQTPDGQQILVPSNQVVVQGEQKSMDMMLNRFKNLKKEVTNIHF